MKYKMPFAATAFQHNSGVEELLNAILYGGKAIQYSKLTITGAGPENFADAIAAGHGIDGIPVGAQFALCILEADAAQVGAARVCRFRQEDIVNAIPSADNGMPVGDNGSFEIAGEDNIANFSIIAITPANTHTLHITWFGAS